MTRPNDRLRPLRDDRRAAEPRKPARKGLVGKVLGILAVVALAGLFFGRPGCHASVQQARTLPPKKKLAGLSPKELQQQTAEYGIEGGAAAGMKVVNAAKDLVPPAGEEPPDLEVRATDGGFVVLKVRSTHPHVLPRDRQQALNEAVEEARRVLVEQGKAPPGGWKVNYDPARVRDVPPDESLRQRWAASGLDTDRGWVEIEEVTLSYDTLRQERAKARTAEAGFWFGTAFLGLLAAYGFLRLDMWTKGYLTLVLGIAVGGVVVAAVAALGMLIW